MCVDAFLLVGLPYGRENGILSSTSDITGWRAGVKGIAVYRNISLCPSPVALLSVHRLYLYYFPQYMGRSEASSCTIVCRVALRDRKRACWPEMERIAEILLYT